MRILKFVIPVKTGIQRYATGAIESVGQIA